MGDYRTRFFRPYRDLDCPIFAIPGNHDWYDGLHGFMSHLCGIDVPQAPLEVGPGLRGHARAPAVAPHDAARATPSSRRCARRARGTGQALRPAAARPLLGARHRVRSGSSGSTPASSGSIDAEQAEWLRRVSFGSDRPKILVTGKPLIVNGAPAPGRDRQGESTTSCATRAPATCMAIGGDTHNYQRYPVGLPDGRTIQYVVSGGGGAYMHATHQIDRVDVDGVDRGRTSSATRCAATRSRASRSSTTAARRADAAGSS